MQQQHHHHQKHHPHNGLSRDSFSPPPASDSSFSSVVVDIDAIELEKENIQPLRQGRSAQTLTRLFTTQHDDRAQQQAAMHGRFQEELSHTDDLDDPMDVYSRYVKWMIENYPQSAGQGHDSQLSPVLERAIADFKDDQRYRNDPRFVKLLIIYSEKITNTIELFNFMEANGIGSEIAMYYEEFADFLESREEFDRAREVFITGINRRARPLGRLKKQYEDFERRAQVFKDELELEAVESAQPASAQPQQHHQQIHSAEASSVGGAIQRRVLGVKVSGTRSVHSNASVQGHVPIGQERSASSTTTSGIRSTGSSGSSGPSRPNARLQVYTDQPSQPSAPTKPKATSKGSTPQTCVPWRDFGAEQVRRKENTREVSSWKGATLSSEDTVPRRILPKLEVYRDPEVSSPPKGTAQPLTSISSPRGEYKPPSPLVPVPTNHTPVTITSLNDAQSRSSYTPSPLQKQDRESSEQKFPLTINASGRPERLMIDLNDVYVDDEEFSIDEIRARGPLYAWRHTNNVSISNGRKKSPSPSPSPLASPPPPPPTAGSSAKRYRDDPGSGPVVPGMSLHKKAQPDNEHDSLSTPYRTQASSLSVKELLPQSPSDGERHFLGSRRRLTASPTMNTKYASEEMNKIFSDRSRTRRSMDSQWSAEDTQDVGWNELDNFTMAYSIPNLPLTLPPFSREHLESEIVNEFEDDDDQEGRTEGFVRRLEAGHSSTITQDIAALKRRRAEEMTLGDITQSSQGNRLSFREGNRLSSRFDPFRTQESDITIAIRQRTQQLQQGKSEGTEGKENRGTTAYGYLRPSLGRTSFGSLSSAQRPYGSEGGGQNSVESSGQDELESPFMVFKDGAGNLDTGMAVPMLEDEAPPAFMDKDEPI